MDGEYGHAHACPYRKLSNTIGEAARLKLRFYRLPTLAFNPRYIACIIQRTRKRLQPLRDFLFIDIHHAHTFQASP